MGFLATRAAARKAAPQSLPIGPWLEQARAATPFVPEDRLPAWAGISTVLTAPVSYNTSVMPDGRHNSLARWLREQPSVLRFDHGPSGAATLDLGGVRGLGEWKQDWSLRFTRAQSPAECVADVPVYATRDGSMVNAEALDRIRGVLAETLLRGPGLRVREGRPDPGGQIAPVPLEYSNSPVGGDFFAPPDESAAGSWPVAVPSALIVERAGFFRFRTGQDAEPGVELVYLAPDGDPAGGVLRVRPNGPEGCLLDAPAVASDVPAQVRWKRRLATALNWLSVSRTLSAGAQDLARFRDAVVGAVGTNAGWQAVWSEQVPAPAWRLAPGGEFPVCVRLRSERGFQGADCGKRAMDSVAAFRCGYGSVTGRNTMWGSRRPSQLTLDQGRSMLPRVRFGCHTEESDAVSGAVIPDPAHFWEVQWGMVAGSWNDTVLTVTAMSRIRDVLPYAQELQAYLDAYCDLALAYDPDIRFTTVYVTC
ncbi:hypothetical protein [Streptomyces sp. HPF1205]|uniref:hypothetical protein n=1 Tax=Streptomyces sp. HPF1205 TaxID=2873262 RepID=UPI001CED0D3A|nr:hypothetical protein [Streptomyces sp. HPF1205]